ncbi:hypothetical protein FRUB_09764 [Fimbriiglobus ruber]|uniref:Uncharacterized protein n=2 Tax=Fimbriiglobus ruber TaxID=1908690 RepID=A0A225D087_9BACT|nr:hypothetical protein FRUB_09764 [Fimbriiglobus ruber]
MSQEADQQILNPQRRVDIPLIATHIFSKEQAESVVHRLMKTSEFLSTFYHATLAVDAQGIEPILHAIKSRLIDDIQSGKIRTEDDLLRRSRYHLWSGYTQQIKRSFRREYPKQKRTRADGGSYSQPLIVRGLDLGFIPDRLPDTAGEVDARDLFSALKRAAGEVNPLCPAILDLFVAYSKENESAKGAFSFIAHQARFDDAGRLVDFHSWEDRVTTSGRPDSRVYARVRKLFHQARDRVKEYLRGQDDV